MKLTGYAERHGKELQQLLQAPEWREAVSSGLVGEAAADRLSPGTTRSFIDTVVHQLIEFNQPAVRAMIDRGCRDAQRLLERLSQWPEGLHGKSPAISFLGLNVTAECNLQPRCVYCNQSRPDTVVGMESWRKIVDEVTADGDGEGPYVYITGGEPLLLGTELWGDEGLIRFATQRGAAVNVNTNASLITPEIALRLVRAGLAKLHVSLDTADERLHEFLRGREPLDRVLRGIYNVQLARDLLGVSYPVIHTNCVLTRKNLHGFPRLLAFLLEKRKQAVERDDPFAEDLLPHVIPVGGDGNRRLRPEEGEFREFYESVWAGVCRMWEDYQDGLGVAAENRRALFGYFSNPFLRVQHQGGLEAYVKASAEGRYGRLALSRQCYVAPTQAAFTPDGNQYRCGSHAIRRILPLGNIRRRGVFDSIREGIPGLADLPRQEHCYGCATATLYINQSVEVRLAEAVGEMLKGPPAGAPEPN